MITIKHSGNFNNTERLLNAAQRMKLSNLLSSYGNQGVLALASATPRDTGLTASSWSYEIDVTKRGYSIYWTNSNTVSGIPIVILLQYGHGNGHGGYISGRDFINPAIRPIFDKITENLWKELLYGNY